jgi:hypothetical protein
MEVNQGHEVTKGDVLDMFYHVSGWCKRSKIESLVHEVDQDPRWSIRQYEYNEETGALRLRVHVEQNPFPVVVIVVAVAAVGAGLFAWLTLDKVEKITTSPVGAALGMGTMAAAVLGLYTLAKRS